MQQKKFYFTVRDKVLCDVVYDVERHAGKVLSLRCGCEIRIRGAGRFLVKDELGQRYWRKIKLIEHFTKLSKAALYLVTETQVWKIRRVDKANPTWIDNMCDSWLTPEELALRDLEAENA